MITDLADRTMHRELALIVGAARSGTTLTRLLLDSHAEIGCPSEAGLPALMNHMANVWSMVHADEARVAAPEDPGAGRGDGEPPTRWGDLAPNETMSPIAVEADDERKLSERPRRRRQLSPAAREWIVSSLQVPMTSYCAGKAIYCDKSLDSVHHLDLVADLFPRVRIVILVRHVMDTIASGIEASPWGFQAYGYAPYTQSFPGNSVAALTSYWLDHVRAALAFEKEQPHLCHRVRYEDLVMRPEEIVTGIQRFLGVAEDLSVLQAAFRREHPRGPGDYKIEHTTRIHASSIGHGKRVPVAMLPPTLLDAVNHQLDALGYDSLGRGWNAAERPVDNPADGLWATRLTELMSTLKISAAKHARPFAVIAEDHRTLRWIIDPATGAISAGDGEVDAVLTGAARDLVLMLAAEENVGVLLRSGRIRHVLAEPDQPEGQDLMHEVHGLIDLLQQGAATRVSKN